MIVDSIIDICRPMPTPKYVYTLYIAARIKRALSRTQFEYLVNEEIIETSSIDLKTVGDCQYDVVLKDFNGTQYRIVVTTESDAKRRDAEYGDLIQCRGALRLIRAAAEARSTGTDPLAFIASLAKETLFLVENKQ